jgi:hypothetical protein
MTPEEMAAWGERSRAASGVPETIEDEATLVRLARLLRGVDEHADGGPVQPARRRTPVMSTAAISKRRTMGHDRMQGRHAIGRGP